MNQTRQANFKGLLLIVALVAAVAISLAVLLRNQEKGFLRPSRGGLGPGNPMPAIEAEGWLNGPAPTPEHLKGNVLVVDAWAYWCGPCLAAAPELVATYDKFHDRGVVFLGLTPDSAEDIPKMQQFLRKGTIPWPCGYGATKTLTDLEVESIPQVWVVGSDGKISWNFDAEGHLDDAIEEALTAAKVVDTQKSTR